jgi:hypothetical protein
MPSLHAADLRNDTLFVRVSDTAMKIAFIGQGGQIRKETPHATGAWYALQRTDTYIRAQIQFYNPKREPGTKMYLNPVIRYDGEQPVNVLTAAVNVERTWIFRLMSFGSLIMIGWVLYKMRAARKRKKKE